ncbi:MAG: DUF2339 domain-containing protein, partial [Sphingomonas sp.]
MLELFFLLVLGGFAAIWASNRELKRRIGLIEQRLGVSSMPFAGAEEPASETPPTVVDRRPAEERIAAQAGAAEVTGAEAEAPAFAEGPEDAESDGAEAQAPPGPPPPGETLGALFERLVAGRLLIWLGGIALVVAAIYLIRYSIEIGLVTPGLRMIAAALFGLALIGAGEVARARITDDPRIAQALVGAGVAVLYATAYGSHILYGLIGSGAASAAMLAITGAALGLSLRHGAPTAVMGLVGGFLTPLLVGDPDAGAVPLLAYLGLLDLAIFLIAWRRGWTWLAASAVALSFVWSAFLLTQGRDDALAAGAFVLLLAVAASLARPGKGKELSLVQPLLIGLAQLAFLAARVDGGPVGWALFGALGAAAMVLAALRPEARLGPPAALALGLMILFLKAAGWRDPFAPEAALGITAIFGLGGMAMAWLRAERLWAGVAAAGLAAPLLILRAVWPELAPAYGWG